MAAICVSSIGLEDIIARTKFAQQAPHENQQTLPLLSTGMSLIRKAIFQNSIALDIIIAPQEGICATIQTECCVLIPDESVNVSSSLNNIKIHVNSLSEHPSLGDLVNQWFGLWGFDGKSCH